MYCYLQRFLSKSIFSFILTHTKKNTWKELVQHSPLPRRISTYCFRNNVNQKAKVIENILKMGNLKIRDLLSIKKMMNMIRMRYEVFFRQTLPTQNVGVIVYTD